MQTTYSTPKVSSPDSKKAANPQNYKIVKCKYWEKEGTCRYGTLCTFAHGDTEIRSKTENLLLNQQQMGFYDMNAQVQAGVSGVQGMNYADPNYQVPFGMMNPYAMGFDPNLMMNPNMMMGMPQGFDPNMMMNMMGLNMNPNYPQQFLNPNQPGGQQGTGQLNNPGSNGNTN